MKYEAMIKRQIEEQRQKHKRQNRQKHKIEKKRLK